MEMSTRRPSVRRPRKWEYPLTPRIIQLPRRPCTRRKSGKSGRREKLENMFDWGTGFLARGQVRVATEEEKQEEEEKWRVEAEMLRAECNMLRVEKEEAKKKVQRKRERIERTLQSAVHILLAGKERISEGDDVSYVLEERIENLVEKLQRLRRKPEAMISEAKDCNNFDKQASLLKRRLKKFDGKSSEICLRDTREMAEASLSLKPDHCPNRICYSDDDNNMEILRRKMEALSKGNLLEIIKKEYDSMISISNSSVACSSSSSKQTDNPHLRLQPFYKETRNRDEKLCSGHCKLIVRKLADEVKVETEQWSQMQEMLHQVKAEMEELQTSKDYWEDRSLMSDRHIQSLRLQVQEWREKTNLKEKKVNELQAEVVGLKEELEKVRNNSNPEEKEENPSQRASKEQQTETILGILVRRLKENRLNEERREAETICSSEVVALKRSPLRDVGNVSSATRPRSKLIPSYLRAQ